MSYLVVGVAYIHKEPLPVVGRTHIYELLQLETVCILVRYSNTLTFSAHSNELVTYFFGIVQHVFCNQILYSQLLFHTESYNNFLPGATIHLCKETQISPLSVDY